MSTQLKVTSIERYHLCDDTTQNPNVIGCELLVSGHVDRDMATSALREIAQRHPTIHARLKQRHWVLDPADVALLNWRVIESNSVEDLRKIDLDQGLATRFLLCREGDLTRIVFQTHHAMMDGGGGLQIVNDWLLAYHRISTRSDKPKSRETNPEILPARNDLRLLSRGFLSKLWIQPVAILGASKFLFRRVTAITEGLNQPGAAAEPSGFQVLCESLAVETVGRLKQEASASNATVNELILRAVFLGMHQFRRNHNLHERNEWLRLIIPMSMRDFADRRLPACNRATIVQLDRKDRDFADPAGMVGGLNCELGNIKSWNLERTFPLVVRMLSYLPGFLARSARKDVCRATSVVTNLGAPFERSKLERIGGKLRSGNLIVEDVGLIVPLRQQTPIGFALMRYNGQQKICMHFDPCQIERQHAAEILQEVVQCLKKGAVAEQRQPANIETGL